MGFEFFEPIFGEAKAENSTTLTCFLFHVYALDSFRLKIHVTDFQSSTWEAVRSVQQLEDMKDNIGIGGSWSEFLNYVIASLKSEDVKLVMEGQSQSGGAGYAKLNAQKLKGMPRISIPLVEVVGVAASKAMANLSLDLYKSFKTIHQSLINEQERCCQLTKVISAEQERSESIQRHLNSVLNSKQWKSQIMSDKASADGPPIITSKDSSDKPTAQNLASSKITNRVVPAYRRAKNRGVLLQDNEDDEN